MSGLFVFFLIALMVFIVGLIFSLTSLVAAGAAVGVVILLTMLWYATEGRKFDVQ